LDKELQELQDSGVAELGTARPRGKFLTDKRKQNRENRIQKRAPELEIRVVCWPVFWMESLLPGTPEF
jgi:hypothetical protein